MSALKGVIEHDQHLPIAGCPEGNVWKRCNSLVAIRTDPGRTNFETGREKRSSLNSASLTH